MKILLLILSLYTSVLSFAQNNSKIEGFVINQETKKPIPYVFIYNHTTNKGTITNNSGYYNLRVNSEKDSIICNYIGYKPSKINLKISKTNYITYLNEINQSLSEVIVTGSDQLFLFKIVLDCKSYKKKKTHNAKAYYELKSTINNKTVEVVENFYNADITGYDLTKLSLKAGRFGLQFFNNNSFVSLESSRAILNQNLFTESNLFPISPLELKKRKLIKQFKIKLIKKYTSVKNDTIYVLKIIPKLNNGKYFTTKIWIDIDKNQIIKINFTNPNSERHPFLAITKLDTLINVSLNITKTFKSIKDEIILNHIDFNYDIEYKNRTNQTYLVSTSAVIHIYDFKNTFNIPKFDFFDPKTGDYRKISALPYNSFFWNYHDELKINHQNNINEQFMKNPKTQTNQTFFDSNKYSIQGFYQHPYKKWSKKRITFKETTSKTPYKTNFTTNSLAASSYQLKVKLFLDMNTYSDSTNIITSTIFDPFESYYFFTITKETKCFINMYFDILEIERRKLEKEIKNSDKTTVQVEIIYANSMKRITKIEKDFFMNIKRGTSKQEMIFWNKYIIRNLGIDNIKFFNVYDD